MPKTLNLTAAEKVKLNKYINQGIITKLDLDARIKGIQIINYLLPILEDKLKSDSTSTNASIYKIIELIDYIIRFVHENKVEVPEELIDRLYNIQRLYINYVNQTGKNIEDLDSSEMLAHLMAFIKENYQVKELTEEEQDNLALYIDKIAALEAEISTLKKSLSEATKKISALESSEKSSKEAKAELVKICEDVKEKSAKITSLQAQLEKAKNKATRLERTKDSKIKKIEEQKVEIATKDAKILEDGRIIQTLIDGNTDLNNALERVRLENEEHAAKLIVAKGEIERIQQAIIDQDRQRRLIKFIITLFYNNFAVQPYGKLTLEEIRLRIPASIGTFSLEEIKKALIEINGSVKVIDERYVSYPQTYGITNQPYRRTASLKYNSSNECINILVKADEHNRAYGLEERKRDEVIANYEAKVGAELTLVLGDKFDADYDYDNFNSRIYNRVMALLETYAQKYPYTDTPQILIGGNHERRLYKAGINPLEMLASMNNKFLYLSDEHGFLNLQRYSQNNMLIGLHHGNLLNAVSNYEEQIDETKRYLANFYQSQTVCKGSQFIDLLAHMHEGKMRTQDGFIISSKLFDMSDGNGIYHIKFYPGDNACTIIPLTFQGSTLVSNTGVDYQKQR